MIFKGLILRKKRRSRRVRRDQGKIYAREPRRREGMKGVIMKRGIYVLSVLLVGAAIYFFFYSDYFSIRAVEVVRDDAIVNSEVDEEFFSHLLGQNIFLVPSSLVSDKLAEGNYSVESFRLRRSFPNTLRIELTGFPAVARTSWLGDEYYINEDGFLIPASEGSSAVLPYISLQLVSPKVNTAESALSSDLSFGGVFQQTFTDRVAYPRDLEKIIFFLERFDEDFGIEVLEVEYYRVPHEIALHTLSGTRILLDLNKSIDSQLYKLRIASDTLGLTDGRAHEVDLRIGNDRIFYSE